MHFQHIIALLKWLSIWTVALCLAAPRRMCCNCSEMQCFLWLTATCYFILILSAPSSSAEVATVRQKMKIFQGVPCFEASGDGGFSGVHFCIRAEERLDSLQCCFAFSVKSAKYPLTFFILLQKVVCVFSLGKFRMS